MSRNKHIFGTIKVDDDQDDVSITRLRNIRQRRGDAPTPRIVEEIPLLVKKEPQELKKENMVDEIGIGIVEPRPLTEFNQLCKTMRNWIEFTMERERRKDKDISSTSYAVQGVNLTPPIFTGMNSSEDPQRFLDDIWRRCEALGCTDHQAVSLASFRLEGYVTSSWFESRKRARPIQGEWTWEEFSTMFLDRCSTYEFERLSQGSMTVDEYDMKFTQLSRYAKHVLPTEEWRVKRFIKGLKSSIYIEMVSQVFSSYSSAVDYARLIEAQELEDMVAGQSKRPRGKGNEMVVMAPGFKGGLDRDFHLVAQMIWMHYLYDETCEIFTDQKSLNEKNSHMVSAAGSGILHGGANGYRRRAVMVHARKSISFNLSKI
uniref:Retrotransposon gag domain-containing protein n=1 Tax=Salix viminalis TaxID=40686 RepID=A0A6N2MLC2_SALVM